MESDLVAWVREAFDLGDGFVTITAGARGARGQVWRLTVASRVYAVKRVFAGVPAVEAVVAAEVAFTQRAAAAGVQLAMSHADRQGRYVVPLAGGGWLRLYDWVDLRPADLVAAAEALGVLLARLHRCAPASDCELDGASPDQWYAVPPASDGWAPLVSGATEAGASWAPHLSAVVDGLPALQAILSSPDPARMRLCHRDLHPGNVLADEGCGLVVVDWDDLGPLDPARDLVCALVSCFHDGEADLSSMQRSYRAYRETGGVAQVLSMGDFTMVVAKQMNFLHRQVRIALDPRALPRDRAWAELEVEEGLQMMPTPELLRTMLRALRAVDV